MLTLRNYLEKTAALPRAVSEGGGGFYGRAMREAQQIGKGREGPKAILQGLHDAIKDAPSGVSINKAKVLADYDRVTANLSARKKNTVLDAPVVRRPGSLKELFVAEKTAGTRHVVGAGLGATAGLLHALHRDQRVKEQDQLLEDMGQMPWTVHEMRNTRRRGAMLRDAIVGGVAGGAAGHLAPAGVRALRTHIATNAKTVGDNVGRGMREEFRAGAREMGREAGHGVVDSLSQRTGEIAGSAGHAATTRSLDAVGERVRSIFGRK